LSNKILIVDDSTTSIEIISKILHEKYDILIANDGASAIEIAQKKEPDIILLDIHMPNMNGFDVAKNIKLNQKTSTISIIFVTVDTKKESIVKAMKFDGDDYIAKPINEFELIKSIEHQIEKRQILLENQEQKQQIDIQKEYETIFKTSKDGIAILDLKANFLDCNDAYIDITGFTKDEILQKSYISISTTEDIIKSQQAIREAINSGYVKNLEKSCFNKSGKIITVNSSISLMPNKDKLLISLQDITDKNKQAKLINEQKQKLEQLNKTLEIQVEKKIKELRDKDQLLIKQSKMAAMGEMMSNIAHQWRQPLSLINNTVTEIEFDIDLDELENVDIQTFKKCSKEIRLVTSFLSKTVDDFRNFFKPTKEKEDFNLLGSIDEALNILQSKLKNKQIALNVMANHFDKMIVNGYPNEFKHVIINLINNAEDALTQNNIKNPFIDIETSKEDGKSIIEISDNAGGIEDHIIDKIFDPYFTTKYQSQGTGIGLYMSKMIIEKNMGGKIMVENTKDGAKFTIILK